MLWFRLHRVKVEVRAMHEVRLCQSCQPERKFSLRVPGKKVPSVKYFSIDRGSQLLPKLFRVLLFKVDRTVSAIIALTFTV